MQTVDLLKNFGVMVEELSNTTSNNEQKEILEKHGTGCPELLKLMEYIY